MRSLFLIAAISFYEPAYGCAESHTEVDCNLKPSPKLGEPLEVYHHSKLTVLSINDATATILAPDGKKYFVKTGDKVGSYYGVVVKINEGAVVVDELVPTGMDSDCNGEGSWGRRSIELKVGT